MRLPSSCCSTSSQKGRWQGEPCQRVILPRNRSRISRANKTSLTPLTSSIQGQHYWVQSRPRAFDHLSGRRFIESVTVIGRGGGWWWWGSNWVSCSFLKDDARPQTSSNPTPSSNPHHQNHPLPAQNSEGSFQGSFLRWNIEHIWIEFYKIILQY